MSKFALLAAVVLAAAATLVLPASASAEPAAVAVPVTGTTSDGGTFAGTFDVQQVVVENGRTIAHGTLSGTMTDSAGNATAVQGESVSAPVQAQQEPEGCTLFSFSFGPFDINVAGLVTIHLDPIALDIRLEGLLGQLLCGLLGGFGTTPARAAEPQ